MFTRPDDWTPEALEAARSELSERNVECTIDPVPVPATEHTGRIDRWWSVVRKRMIAKWRTWSAARKGMVIGALIGFCVTTLISGLFIFLLNNIESGSPMEVVGWLMLAVIYCINSPFVLLFEATHWRIESYAATACVAVVINTSVYAIIGGFIGYAAHQFRKLIRRMGWVKDMEQNTQPTEPYYGPRCVRCNEPVSPEIKNCPKCGWTQPG
jgi:hypothetical protein